MTDIPALIAHAAQRGWMIATAESCTGGMVAAAITEVPGASAVFERGFVTYSNAAKMDMLGVPKTVLDQTGAVSEETARAMASGALARSEAQLAVSITGIAGPGGSDFKPEGRVCFGLASSEGVTSALIDFGALGRRGVRQAACEHALSLLFSAVQPAP